MENKYCLLHEVNGSLKWRLNLCVWVYVCVCSHHRPFMMC